MKEFYKRLLELIATKTSWGKNELTDAVKDLYIEILTSPGGQADE